MDTICSIFLYQLFHSAHVAEDPGGLGGSQPEEFDPDVGRNFSAYATKRAVHTPHEFNV
jgi:hypothetical protein